MHSVFARTYLQLLHDGVVFLCDDDDESEDESEENDEDESEQADEVEREIVSNCYTAHLYYRSLANRQAHSTICSPSCIVALFSPILNSAAASVQARRLLTRLLQLQRDCDHSTLRVCSSKNERASLIELARV